MLTRAATTVDIPGILELQEKNLLSSLSPEERRDGFVTTPFTAAQLTDLIGLGGVFIIDADGVVGYMMAASWQYFSQWDIFTHMTDRLPLDFRDHKVTSDNSFQYGPVCIDVSQRGTGIFAMLFETMRLAVMKDYLVGLTFINQVNQHSYHAHVRKLGMELVDTFDFSGQSYYTLAFDTAVSVLG